MLVEYLKHDGYQVSDAASGQEALDIISEKPPDILLTDIMMPKMSGIDLTKKVLSQYPDTVAIAITSAGSTDSAVNFMKIGGIDYILKPFNSDSLKITIENAIKNIQLKSQLKLSHQELVKKNQALEIEIENRLAIQKSLEDSRNDLKAVFDSMNDFVFILDSYGCILNVNPVVCQQLGYTQEELTGLNILELHSPKPLKQVTGVVSNMLSSTPALLVGHLLKKNQEPIDVETKINTTTWNGEKALIAVSRNMTEYKKAQRNMESIIEAFRKGEIDAIVHQDEVFLLRSETQVRNTEAHLKESEKKQQYLAQMNQAKDRFFSILGHDLRGMFNTLMISSNMVLKIASKEKMPKLLKFTESMKKATHNAYELLENLLTWSRSQRGMIQVSKVQFDLCKLIDQNIELFAERASQKSIELSSDTPEQLLVKADRNMADTILRNLIANALKFTHPNGHIHIFTHIKRNQVEVSVQDNGTGIPKSDLEKLFQIDSNYKRQGTANEKGTGLGLIMCKELAIKNDGDIWATSEENKGCVFTFSLDLIESTTVSS